MDFRPLLLRHWTRRLKLNNEQPFKPIEGTKKYLYMQSRDTRGEHPFDQPEDHGWGHTHWNHWFQGSNFLNRSFPDDWTYLLSNSEYLLDPDDYPFLSAVHFGVRQTVNKNAIPMTKYYQSPEGERVTIYTHTRPGILGFMTPEQEFKATQKLQKLAKKCLLDVLHLTTLSFIHKTKIYEHYDPTAITGDNREQRVLTIKAILEKKIKKANATAKALATAACNIEIDLDSRFESNRSSYTGTLDVLKTYLAGEFCRDWFLPGWFQGTQKDYDFLERYIKHELGGALSENLTGLMSLPLPKRALKPLIKQYPNIETFYDIPELTTFTQLEAKVEKHYQDQLGGENI